MKTSLTPAPHHRMRQPPRSRGLRMVIAAGLLVPATPLLASGLVPVPSLTTTALFDPSTVYLEAGQIGFVAGNIHLFNAGGSDRNNQPVTNGATRTPMLGHYNMNYGTIKVALGKHVDCMLDDVPSAYANYSPNKNWVGRYALTQFTISSYQQGLTCSVAVNAGPGRFRLIAGYVRTHASIYKSEAYFNPITADLSLTGQAHGLRFGAAYEIPEYAMRIVAMYQQDQPASLTGTTHAYIPGLAPLNVGNYLIKTAVPRIFQLDLQSGIKPGWLGFASFNWQRWSELQNLPNIAPGAGIADATQLYMRNALMVTAGVGHSLNEHLDLFAALTWAQGGAGRTNPLTTATSAPGTNLDELTLGGKYKVSRDMDIKAGISAIHMNGGSFDGVGGPNLPSQSAQFHGTFLYYESVAIDVHF